MRAGRLRIAAVVLVVVTGVAVDAPARAADYELAAEIGSEYDSNARRSVEGDQVVESPLLRIVVDGRLGGRVGRHYLAAGYGAGAKVFAAEDARMADEVVHYASASWAVAVGRAVALRWSGRFYDAFQRVSQRDFRTGSLWAELILGRQTTISSRLGYRGLQFKPVADYSFHALVGGLSVARRFETGDEDEPESWRLALTYGAELRAYEGPAIGARESCDGSDGLAICNYAKTEARADLNQVLRASADYLGNADVGLWYAAELNRANSYGESFVRHVVGIRFTARLFWEIYMTSKAVLQLSRFSDPYLVSPLSSQSFVNIEDENRSTLLVHFGRDITSRVAVNLRYAVYVNENTGQGAAAPDLTAGFIRHLVFAGVKVRLSDAGED